MTDLNNKNSLVAENKAKFESLTQSKASEQNDHNSTQKPVKKLPIEKITPFGTPNIQNDGSVSYENKPSIFDTQTKCIDEERSKDNEIKQLSVNHNVKDDQKSIVQEDQIHCRSDTTPHEVRVYDPPETSLIIDQSEKNETKNRIPLDESSQNNISSKKAVTNDDKNMSAYTYSNECFEETQKPTKSEIQDICTSNTTTPLGFSTIKHKIEKQMTESFFKDTRFKRQNPFLLDQITDDENDEKNNRSG